MKYGKLSDKILEITYQQPEEKISEEKLLSLLLLRKKDIKQPLGYLKKLEYIEIKPAFSFFFFGGNDIYGDSDDGEEEPEDKDSDMISLTKKGIKYCENISTSPTQEIKKFNKELNIFSKNNFLSKNTVEGNSLSGSESILGKLISFLKEIFIK